MIDKIINNKSKSLLLSIFRYAFITGLVFTILFPQLNKIIIAFRSQADLVDSSIIFFPKHFSVSAFEEAWVNMEYVSALFKTLLVCTISALLHVASCTLTAYSIAKFDYRFKGLVYGCVILTFLVPPSLISLPLYSSFQSFDIFGIFSAINGEPLLLLDNPATAYMLYATANGLKSGLFIFLLVQFFKNMPRVLDEAAEVDGATNTQIMFNIALPAARTMIVTVFLFTFVWQWTDTNYTEMFFSGYGVMATALTNSLSRDITKTFVETSQLVSSSSVLFTIPLVFIYVICNKAFVQSIENSGIVG